MEVIEPDFTYHIYNRANGDELLFRNQDNYRFFLEKAKTYLAPIAEFYTYCLMPNHFHFLLRFKSEKELQENLAGFQNLQGLDKLPAQILSNFLNGYAKAYNKIYNRKGSLFMRNAGRVKVQTDEYLKELIKYIQSNRQQNMAC